MRILFHTGERVHHMNQNCVYSNSFQLKKYYFCPVIQYYSSYTFWGFFFGLHLCFSFSMSYSHYDECDFERSVGWDLLIYFQKAREGRPVPDGEGLYSGHSRGCGPLPAAEEGLESTNDWRISWEQTETVQQGCFRVSICFLFFIYRHKSHVLYRMF